VVRFLAIFRGVKIDKFCHPTSPMERMSRSDSRGFDSSFVKKAAFTLPEVLITIGVIGIVAVMTIPSLMTKIEEKVLIEQLWQTYNIVHNATRQMLAEEVGVMDVRLLSADMTNAYNTWKELLPRYTKVMLSCPYMKAQGVCNGKSYKKYGNKVYNSSAPNYRTYVLANGATIIFHPSVEIGTTYNQCGSTITKLGFNATYFNGCGAFYVDVNGKKGPNMQGKDFFRFYLVRDGIVPGGSKQENVWTQTFHDDCMKNNGESCAAWALYNRNMDYLRCKDDLSWDGNRSCPKK